MTIEQIIPELLTGGEVVLPSPGPVVPSNWYVAATVLGGHGAVSTTIEDHAGTADFASVAGATVLPKLTDDGQSRFVTIHGATANRLENGNSPVSPFTVSMLVRSPVSTTIARFGRYRIDRAADGRWALFDNGTTRVLYVSSTDGAWTLLTLVCNGASSAIYVNSLAAVTGGTLDGNGTNSSGMLGNTGTTSTVTYDLAELQVNAGALTAGQVASVHAAIRSRHPLLAPAA